MPDILYRDAVYLWYYFSLQLSQIFRYWVFWAFSSPAPWAPPRRFVFVCMLVLSHFKGHAMAGFGGAIKNISIGLGSAEGKCWIHSGGTSRTSPWGGGQTAFTESMAEAGKAVSDYLGSGEKIVYVNVMNRLSIDCDCDGNPAEPDLHDIGILASADPVALDQACIDLIYAQKDGDGASLVNRIESRNGLHTLEHAEEIGLGSRSYQLVSVE